MYRRVTRGTYDCQRPRRRVRRQPQDDSVPLRRRRARRAERARRTSARRAAEKRMKRLLGPDYRNPERAPEHRSASPASAGSAAIRLRPAWRGRRPPLPEHLEGQYERVAYYEARKLNHLPHSPTTTTASTAERRRPSTGLGKDARAVAAARWLMPRDRRLRGVSWPLWGAMRERRRCWTPRGRSPFAKRTRDARPLRGLRPSGSGPDAPDRASGRGRSWHQPSSATFR